MNVTTIRNIISVGTGSNSKKMCVFTGFIESKKLKNISFAPSFLKTETFFNISNNIRKDNVEKWQRPENEAKIKEIVRLYNNTITPQPNFMINPVLLTENYLLEVEDQKIKITDIDTEKHIYDIYFPDLESKEKNKDDLPLWIIDGQHRISGIAKSNQSTNSIPFVLMLDFDRYHKKQDNYISDPDIYSKEAAGRIFAEVNTKNTALDDTHKAWLAYHFEFDTKIGTKTFKFHNYKKNVTAKNWHNSFETVVILTSDKSSVKNPFHNEINFNKHNNKTARPTNRYSNKHPFTFKNYELCEIIYQYYYSAKGKIIPADLSDEIIFAYSALANIDKAHWNRRNVFFGETGDGLLAIQRPFLRGVLTYLLYNRALGSTALWEDFLTKVLKFNIDLWEFYTFCKGKMQGKIASGSEQLANIAFIEAFSKKSLPSGMSLQKYLMGDNGSGTCQFSLFHKSIKAGTSISLKNNLRPTTITAKPKNRTLQLVSKNNVRLLEFSLQQINKKSVNSAHPFIDSTGKKITANEFNQALLSNCNTYQKSYTFDHLIKEIKVEITFQHFGVVSPAKTVELTLKW